MSVLLVEELCWDLFLPQKADLFVVIALVTLILLWNLCPEKNPTIFGDSGILIQHFPLSLSPSAKHFRHRDSMQIILGAREFNINDVSGRGVVVVGWTMRKLPPHAG